jgi:hypothetical protein
MRIEILNKKLVEFITPNESASGLRVFTGFETDEDNVSHKKIFVQFGRLDLTFDSTIEAYYQVTNILNGYYNE